MTTTRRELLAALGGAWVLASLGAAPLTAWMRRQHEPQDPLLAPADAGTAHLLDRCGYGARPGEGGGGGAARWIDAQLAPDAIDDDACERRLRRLDTLHLPLGECYEFHDHVVRQELQAGILLRAVHSRRQLRESLVETWRDHFSLSAAKGECAWLATGFERDALRPHALGRFRDLLRAALLHPAMLWYLDGRLNRVDGGGKPNENYARELLELHTLGIDGGYTQDDVQEAARALSGWTTRALGQSRKGAVAFDGARHDAGAKRLLGRDLPAGLGADEVERVVDAVCAHPATARHLARRLCVRYLADQPAEAAVADVADAFAGSGGSIAAAMRRLLAREEFAASRRAKLKRPLHLVASALRACDVDGEVRPGLLAYLERLGHAPYQWPTPDGYPATSGHWRDGLLWRWRFADDLARGAIAGSPLDAGALLARAGGRAGLAAHCLGRQPLAAERDALASGDDAEAVATILSLPGFQRC